MRRRRATKRSGAQDPKYNNKVVGRLIHAIMEKGKKSIAETIVYKSFEILSTKTGEKDILKVFQKAIDNIKPVVEVKSRRVGGATYQVPVEVRHDRSMSLAIRWIRDFARARKGKPMAQRLADELFDAYKNTGSAIKKRELSFLSRFEPWTCLIRFRR